MFIFTILIAFVASAITASAANFPGCDHVQEAAIRAAIPVAKQYTLAAVEKLAADPNGESWTYATWFGEPNKARRNTVLGHFRAVAQNDFDAYTFQCGGPRCVPNDAAYVDATQYGIVYLCSQFWNLPPRSTEQLQSQASTIVHEATHFAANGETRDIKRAVDACRILALDNPKSAVMNAPSHEYFAVESTASLEAEEEKYESEAHLVAQCA